MPLGPFAADAAPEAPPCAARRSGLANLEEGEQDHFCIFVNAATALQLTGCSCVSPRRRGPHIEFSSSSKDKETGGERQHAVDSDAHFSGKRGEAKEVPAPLMHFREWRRPLRLSPSVICRRESPKRRRRGPSFLLCTERKTEKKKEGRRRRRRRCIQEKGRVSCQSPLGRSGTRSD